MATTRRETAHAQAGGGTTVGIEPDVVDPVLVQSKAAFLVGAVDELLYVLPDVVGQLLEEHFGFVVCERSHDSSY